MTRIDFHTEVADKIAHCCKLARKARAGGARLVFLTADRRQLQTLDEALWTFSDREFLPHVALADPLAARTPIILSDRGDGEFPHHEVLINLSSVTPVHFARFERLIELVGLEAEDKAAGRERFRHYRERGYPLEHHPMGQA